MIFFVMILVVSTFIGFIFQSGILHAAIRFCRVKDAAFKRTLLINLLILVSSLAVCIVIYFVFNFVYLGGFVNLAMLPVTYLITHYFLHKYYSTGRLTNFLIYIAYTALSVVISLVVIIPLRVFIFEPFYVMGAAMEPNYADRDYLLIKKFDHQYKRGEVVVFRYPMKPEEFFIKRIIGLPGEKIQIKNDVVTVYNKDFPQGHVLDEPYLPVGTWTISLNEEPVVLGDNEYFMLGDNRKESKDSRSFGPVSSDLLHGKIWFAPLK